MYEIGACLGCVLRNHAGARASWVRVGVKWRLPPEPNERSHWLWQLSPPGPALLIAWTALCRGSSFLQGSLICLAISSGSHPPRRRRLPGRRRVTLIHSAAGLCSVLSRGNHLRSLTLRPCIASIIGDQCLSCVWSVFGRDPVSYIWVIRSCFGSCCMDLTPVRDSYIIKYIFYCNCSPVIYLYIGPHIALVECSSHSLAHMWWVACSSQILVVAVCL